MTHQSQRLPHLNLLSAIVTAVQRTDICAHYGVVEPCRHAGHPEAAQRGYRGGRQNIDA